MKYKQPQHLEDIESLKWRMSYLENQLTGEMNDEQFAIRDEINQIKTTIYQFNHPPQKPDDSNFECFGCGS